MVETLCTNSVNKWNGSLLFCCKNIPIFQSSIPCHRNFLQGLRLGLSFHSPSLDSRTWLVTSELNPKTTSNNQSDSQIFASERNLHRSGDIFCIVAGLPQQPLLKIQTDNFPDGFECTCPFTELRRYFSGSVTRIPFTKRSQRIIFGC